MNHYYYLVTSKLVKGLKERLTRNTLLGINTSFLLLALNRITDLISNSQTSDYTNFLECISFIWDEIRWLSKVILEEAYSKEYLYQKTMSILSAYGEHVSGYVPAYANLGTSGMNVLVKSVYFALQEITCNRTKTVGIKFGKFNYFELQFFLQNYLKTPLSVIQDSEHILYTNGSEKIAKPYDWPDDLISLYIDIPNANVQIEHAGFHYSHVNDVIENQMNIRAQIAQQGGSPPPLICILDVTIGYTDDLTIKWILYQFEEAIEKGDLYLFFVHSFNKYWSMGLDKGYAGFCHQYGNLNRFPHLNALIEQEKTQFNLGGHAPNSSTVSFIGLIMSSCHNLIDAYKAQIHKRSRYLYGQILPHLVERKDAYIKIDDPQSYPMVKGRNKPLMELADYSTFISIRINNSYSVDDCFSRQFYTSMQLLLHKIDVHDRDGFGFAKTTYCCINSPEKILLLRINIGSELIQVLHNRFKRVEHFITEFNKVIERYYPIHQAPSLKNNSILKLEVMNALLEVYLNIFAQDDNLPHIRSEIEDILNLDFQKIRDEIQMQASIKLLTSSEFALFSSPDPLSSRETLTNPPQAK